MKNQPTKETLIRFARRHALDIDGYYQDEKERDSHKREIDAIVRQLKAVRKQCDSFRKQRDELINDIADIKRKAEAWDKLKEDYIIDINSAIDTTLYYSHPNAPAQEDMGAINILLTQLLSDLERGSDVEN